MNFLFIIWAFCNLLLINLSNLFKRSYIFKDLLRTSPISMSSCTSLKQIYFIENWICRQLSITLLLKDVHVPRSTVSCCSVRIIIWSYNISIRCRLMQIFLVFFFILIKNQNLFFSHGRANYKPVEKGQSLFSRSYD